MQKRTHSGKLLVSIAFLIHSIPKTHPFNFDLQNPIVIHDRFDSSESQFGASVLLAVPEDGGNGWVVISAPKANSSIPSYSKIKEPGIVWRCSLGSENTECSILKIDAIGEMDVKKGEVPITAVHRDRKDFGMLGLAMAIGPGSSNLFVVCSSRWCNQKYKEHHLLNGLCYWMPKSNLLSHNSSFPDFSNRLLPLVNASRQAYTFANTNGQTVERRFDWAFGQAGFSVHMTQKNELLLGAPGILEWAGSVVRYRDYDPIKLNPSNRRFNQENSILAQVVVPRAQTQINRKILNYFDYFGYSVTSGHFLRLKNNQTQYAAGAPRGESLSGKVLIFSFRDESLEIGGVPDESLDFIVDPIVGGSSNFFGSYFGYIVAAADVNGDGFDELLVGAPFYETAATFLDSENTSTETENLSGDEGCVFVYFSTGEDFNREPQEICGDNRPGARFGSSIANLIDINHDGFQDVAIGAPYETENRGAVYIYLGSPKRLIFSQKITPEELDPGIRGFGYSVFGGVDIDQNTYGDLAIGAYESNHVVIYRSFAVVDIIGNLTSSVQALGSTTGIFFITSCLTFKGHSIPQELEISIKLTIDTDFWKARNVDFIPDLRVESKNFAKGALQFKNIYRKSGTCYAFNVTTIGDLDAVTVPVIIRQEIWLDKDSNQNDLTPIRFELSKASDGSPVMNAASQNAEFSWTSKAPIKMSASRGGSLAGVLSIPIMAVCEEDGDPSCLADLSLQGTFRTTEGVIFNENAKFVIGSSKSIILQIEVANHRERANLPLILNLQWTNPLLVRSSRSDCRRVESLNQLDTDPKTYTCMLSSPLSRNKKEFVEMELDVTGLLAGNTKDTLKFHLQANTSSLVVRDAVVDISLPMTHKSQLVLLGQQSEASYHENITSETLNFTQLFEVGLTGISPIYGFQLQVAIPAFLHIHGTMFPFLRIREPQITYDGSKMSCRTTNGSLRFYEDPVLYEDNDILRRRKREVSKKRGKVTLMEQPIIINCQTLGVQCLLVECDAYAFMPSHRALVEFRLRLVTETSRRLFTELDRDVLIIESTSSVQRLGSISESRFAVSRTLIRADLPAEIKAWILIVAAGGGLILFALITLILTQCGFFRRHKLEELAKLKAGAQVDEHFQFDDELEMADSLEYFDGSPTETEFNYSYYATHYRPRSSFTDSNLYDELEGY